MLVSLEWIHQTKLIRNYCGSQNEAFLNQYHILGKFCSNQMTTSFITTLLQKNGQHNIPWMQITEIYIFKKERS